MPQTVPGPFRHHSASVPIAAAGWMASCPPAKAVPVLVVAPKHYMHADCVPLFVKASPVVECMPAKKPNPAAHHARNNSITRHHCRLGHHCAPVPCAAAGCMASCPPAEAVPVLVLSLSSCSFTSGTGEGGAGGPSSSTLIFVSCIQEEIGPVQGSAATDAV